MVRKGKVVNTLLNPVDGCWSNANLIKDYLVVNDKITKSIYPFK